MSRAAGAVYDLQGAGSVSDENIVEGLRGSFDPVWHHDIEADIEHAFSLLREEGAFTARSE